MGWRSRAKCAVGLLLLTFLIDVRALPASFVLLPLSSFSNTSLVAAYTCAPTYASTACSGHGSCYLLLNSTAALSLPFLNASITTPITVDSSSLDTYGIHSHTPLPAAVCICDSGWTGRGDYINHYALDGDSCGIDEHAITGLCIVGVVLFVPLLLLALHRLSGWLTWYRQHADGEPTAILTSQLSSDDTDETTKSRANQRSRTANGTISPVVRVISPKAATSPPATKGSAFQYNNVNVKSPTTGGRLTGTHKGGNNGGGVVGRQSVYKRHSGGGSKQWVAMSHISFCHPLCCIVFTTTSAAFYLLRLTTNLTLGQSHVMSALFYSAHNAYYVGICVATYHMLRLAASITRTQTGAGGLSAVMRRVRVCLYGLVGYSFVVWLLLFLLPSLRDVQQTTSIVVLTVLHAPVWAIAVLSLTTTRRITSALIRHLDKLSTQQRDARTAVCRKLRSQSNVVLVMVTLNVAVCAMLAVSGWLRQAGQPYFHLFTQYFCWMTLFIRLLLIQPPGGRAAATTAVTPHPPSHHADIKPPVHSPSNNVAAAAAAAAQARHLRVASSAVSRERPASTTNSRVVNVRGEEEQSASGKEGEVNRGLKSFGSSGGSSAAVETTTTSQKPRLSIVTDVD